MSKTIVWADDEQKIARYIMEVPSGLACRCTCPGCGAALEAVNSENPYWKKRPHFRHHEAPELEDCAASALLAAARQVVKDIVEIKLPAFEVQQQVTAPFGKVFTGSAKSTEEVVSVEAVEFVDATDAILTLVGGQQIRLRLVATTRRSSDPTQPIMGEIAIDLTDPVLQTADPEMLRKHITLADSVRSWCHFQNTKVLEQLALLDAQTKWETFVAKQPPPPPAVEAAPQKPAQDLPRTSITKQHIPVENIADALRAFQKRYKSIRFHWSPNVPDTSKWSPLVPTWLSIFGEQYGDLLDAGWAAREAKQDANEALMLASEQFGFSPHATLGLWVAANLARHG